MLERVRAVAASAILGLLLAVTAQGQADASAGDLVHFGAGSGSGWGEGERVAVDDRSVLLLERQQKGTSVYFHRISVNDWETREVTVSLTSRVTGLRDADPPRDTAKVLIRLERADKSVAAYQVLHPATDGKWHTVSKTFALPAEVASVRLDVGLFNSSGTFAIDAMSLAAGDKAMDHAKAPAAPAPASQTDRFDVTKPPYNADATGQRDSTAALQRAFADARSRFETTQKSIGRRVITVYFPAGTYLVSDTLSFGGGKPQHLRVLGDGQDKTIIRLADNAPGFSDKSAKAVIDYTTGSGASFSSNISFNNAVEGLTIEVGAGNPGAAGLAYHNNNTGYVRNVTIRSVDPEHKGHTGLYLPGSLSGIGYLSHITVDGFDQAAYFRNQKIMYVMEHIAIRNQRVAGIVSDDKPLTIRRLTSDNRVPAIVNRGDLGQIVLVDSELRGGGSDAAAIENKGLLFIRNVDVAGYRTAVADADVPARHIEEYVNPAAVTVDSSALPQSLNLPIKDTPASPQDPRESWAIVDGSAQDDDTDAIQSAIDSGATTVYLPGTFSVSRPIVLRGAVRHLKGNTPGGIGSSHAGLVATREIRRDQPVLRIETGDHDVTVIEDLAIGQEGIEHPDWAIENASDRTVVLRNSVAGPYRNSGRGDVFFESTAGGYGTSAYQMMPHPFVIITNQNAWFRHLNPEGSFPHLVNDGGRVVVLGAKFGEWHGPYVETLNGGQTEILGTMFNSIASRPQPSRAWMVNDHGSLSAVAVDDQKQHRNPHPLALRQFGSQGDQSLTYEQATPRGNERRAVSLLRSEAGPAPAADAPYAWIESTNQWMAEADEPSLAIVARLSKPAAEDVRVAVAVASPSDVDPSSVSPIEPIAIRAGQTEGRGEFRMTRRDVNQQVTLRPVGGGGYRVDPLKPHPTFYVAGSAASGDEGLLLRLRPQAPLADASEEKQKVVPKNVEVTSVDGRPAIVFPAKGSEVILGTGGGSYSGFMQHAFDERSVALWIHGSSQGSAFREGGGFGGFIVRIENGQLQFEVAAGSTRSNTIATRWPGAGWHHVVAVFDDGVQRLFLDGRPVAAGEPISFEIPGHSAAGGLGVFGFTGAVGEVRVYDRALTPREVQQLAEERP